jgi:altronate hydrolase
LPAGRRVEIGGAEILVSEQIPAGHKFALKNIPAGASVVKYGFSIGTSTADVKTGARVHSHNLCTNLSGKLNFGYNKETCKLPARKPSTFMGYRREDGRAAIRNELWIVPTVGCINGPAKAAAQQFASSGLPEGVDGIRVWEHSFGCSQLSEDHHNTQMILAGLASNPNAGGVLVFGLGCENNTMEQFREVLGECSEKRVKFLVAQECEDECLTAVSLLEELAEYASGFKREEISASELVIGLKCGGSDAFSGITANPVVGEVSNIIIAQGGSAILTEIPEMFGAEQMLLNRCKDKETFNSLKKLALEFREYFLSHGEPVGENPSPGNRQGGITTLEDKSLGCVQKAGCSEVVDVLRYGGKVKNKGLTILEGPGNDIVAVTALAAAGCHLILFTTGRGTPLGAPVPVVKIASNSKLAQKKPGWVDFNAGIVVEGSSVERTGRQLFELVLDVASGKRTTSEAGSMPQMAIWKNGVTL